MSPNLNPFVRRGRTGETNSSGDPEDGARLPDPRLGPGSAGLPVGRRPPGTHSHTCSDILLTFSCGEGIALTPPEMPFNCLLQESEKQPRFVNPPSRTDVCPPSTPVPRCRDD